MNEPVFLPLHCSAHSLDIDDVNSNPDDHPGSTSTLTSGGPEATMPAMGSEAFRRLEAGGVRFYSCIPLEGPPNLRHGFSTRKSGVSSPPEGSLNLGYLDWDIPERVDENRIRFLSALGLGDNPLATLAQVHSDQVHIIKGTSNQWNCPPEGDALITGEKAITLAVRAADCFPVLLADRDNRTVGVVHAGWRGILAHILVKTVDRMREAFGTDPGRLVGALGPGIRSCCMEVGPEVASLFEQEFPNESLLRPLPGTGGKGCLDLTKALEADRSVAGMKQENFFDLGLCTHCHPGEFFSFRREGPSSGRMMAAIGFTD